MRQIGIIIDPDDFNREGNFLDGVELCKEFLAANRMRAPEFTNTGCDHPFLGGPGAFGFYRNEVVRVNVPKTALPVRVPYRAWSYTGWKADRTAAGVVAHETGHHVDFLLGNLSLQTPELLEDISSYSKVNGTENWAEAVRLFILNPDLLKCAWPTTYFKLSLSLVPVVTFTWREVLANAHPRFIEVAEKRIYNEHRFHKEEGGPSEGTQ